MFVRFGSLTICCSRANAHESSSLVDSLEWSRTFDIFSISRLSLHSLGIPVELVKSLTDGAMQVIAKRIANMVVQEPDEKFANLRATLPC